MAGAIPGISGGSNLIGGPTPLGNVGEAASQIPAATQQYQINQGQVFQSMLPRLSMISQMLGNDDALKTNPQMINYLDRLTKQLGIPSYTRNVNGQMSIDTQALGSHAPIANWLSQGNNFELYRSMPPEQRAGLEQALGFQNVPAELHNADVWTPPTTANAMESGYQKLLETITKPGTAQQPNQWTPEAAMAAYIPMYDRAKQQGIVLPSPEEFGRSIAPTMAVIEHQRQHEQHVQGLAEAASMAKTNYDNRQAAYIKAKTENPERFRAPRVATGGGGAVVPGADDTGTPLSEKQLRAIKSDGSAYANLSTRAQRLVDAVHDSGVDQATAMRQIMGGADQSLTPRDRQLLPLYISSTDFSKHDKAATARTMEPVPSGITLDYKKTNWRTVSSMCWVPMARDTLGVMLPRPRWTRASNNADRLGFLTGLANPRRYGVECSSMG